MAAAKHQEIRDWIETEIQRGNYSVGDRLPTEQELMDKFAVSRNPVQKAMTALVEAGVVARKRGSGTVVASTGLRSNLLRHLDPTLTGPEVTGDHKVIEIKVASAESFVLSRGVFADDHPTACLTRLKLSPDGLPLAVERSLVDLTLAPDVLSENLEELTTVAYFNRTGLSVRRANTVLKAVHPTSTDAELLGIAASVPVIRQVRTVHLSEERPIEVGEFLIHPQNMTLEVSHFDHS